MNARTRNTRRRSLTRWLAAGVVVLVLGMAGPAGAADAAHSADAANVRAVVNPSPSKKPENNGPVVAQPGDPCLGSARRPNCNPQPKDPTPTYTPTTKPKEPTATHTPTRRPTRTPVPPTDTPTPKPPTNTPVPPTETPVPPPPTNTPVPPTETPVPPPPTKTPVPPTETPVPEPPTATPVPPTNTPVPPTPTNTPVPPTETPVPEPEIVPEVVPEEPTPEPMATPTQEPTNIPVPPTETPVPPTATATETSTPVVVAFAPEPPPTSTPVPPSPEPPVEVEIASSPFGDPNPFILLGTLLFALAAAAGQVLRTDPGMVSRFVRSFDGARRMGEGGLGGSTGSEAMRASDLPRDPQASWSDGYDTLSGHGGPSYPGSTLPDAPTSFASGASSGPAPSSSGLGGSGGLDSLAKSAPGGFDSFAKGTPGGFESSSFGSGNAGVGHDVAANAGGQFQNVQADALGQGTSHPTDWGVSGPTGGEGVPQTPAGGSLGGGAGSELARMPGGLGSELANGGIGGEHGGDLLGRGAGGPADALAHGFGPSGQEVVHNYRFTTQPVGSTGLGGMTGAEGASDVLARGVGPLNPPTNVAGLPATPGFQDVPLQSANGIEAQIAENLETLARSLSPADGATVLDAGTVVAPDSPTTVAPGVGASWLAAGALAKAEHQEPLPKTYRCPTCRKPLVYGHRFCGYCGEPLDKTMA